LSNAVLSLRDAGVIVVAACGNSATNVDVAPTFPACYNFDNVVSVASTTRNDTLAASSSYGPANVHLAAPGENILSTFPATDSFYYTDSGTSFAAPYVSGALALVLARFPSEPYQLAIRRVLDGTDPLPSLAGKCVTGGRLKHFSKHPVRYWIWTQVSKLNTRHMMFAWITLGTLSLTDFYIMLVSSGTIYDIRFIGH